MRKLTAAISALCLSLMLCHTSTAAETTKTNTPITMQMEAGFSFFRPWSSGLTYHSGIGYLKPYGAAEYYCGTGYKEAASISLSQPVKDWLLQHADDTNPLFCIYRVSDGDIYTYDVLVGSVSLNEARNEHVDQVLNVVLGGTGKFKNASGFWVGTTSGRGQLKAIRPEWSLPDSILKLMEGYIRM
ncbi:MAG: hypothetical protein QM808_10700 [Steroidobacteraceae bacterium]